MNTNSSPQKLITGDKTWVLWLLTNDELDNFMEEAVNLQRQVDVVSI